MATTPDESNWDEANVFDTLDPRFQGVAVPPVAAWPEPQPFDASEDLEPYSRSFYETLISAHPEWRTLGRILATKSGDEGGLALFMELRATSAQIGTLWISTEHGVIVGFGELYHTHFYTYEPETDAEVFRRAMQFVDDFIEERLVLVVGVNGERVVGTWIQTRDEADILPEWWFIPELSQARSSYERLRVFSWKNTFDRECIPSRG